MKQYTVTGMSCAACSARVEKAVSKVDGVTSCSVSLLTNSMGVEGSATDAQIVEAVEQAGYGASPKVTATESENDKANNSLEQLKAAQDALVDRETPKLRNRLISSLIFLVVLMYFSMGHMMWGWPLPEFFNGNHVAMGLLQLLLTVAVMVINQKFFISGFKGLIHGAPNMDTLVALGSAASFGYSVYALFAMTAAQVKGDMDAVMSYMHEFYFESAAMILALITVGKMLEAHSKGKTTDALKSLMQLAPKTATVVRDGVEQEISVDAVKKGDIFVVRPGENIPVDGEIIDGTTAVNESALTGESIPVDKQPKDAVSAATVNQSGFIKCRATRVGEDTTLSQIIQMVSDAAATKAPIAKIADRVSGVFVPAVITIAIITIIAWLIAGETVGFALARGISVLVISCPCALGLATPVAIMVGNGKGAKSGILFKTAASLEATGRTQIVALDKTGTITSGEPKVTDIVPDETFFEGTGNNAGKLLAIAASVEAKSEHPLAKAIMERAKTDEIAVAEVTDFSAVVGNGLTAILAGKMIKAGNLAFVSKFVKVSDDMRAKAVEFSKEGKTPLFFAADDRLCGIIAVADTIKEDSPEAVRQLKKMGIRVVMLTGDNEQTANAIGKQAGVDEVIAGVLPDGKEAVIRKLKKQGRVAMVGDGINDAPALTRADMGIAIGAGSDVAIDAADVVLMKSRLIDVPAAVRLSRATLTNIHENLFWAFFYNVIGIPLAAGLWYPLLGWKLNPMFGAAAMSLSSFCVVTNALRLNLCRVYDPKHDRKATPDRKNKTNKPNESEEKSMTKTMNIEGMMCGHCEARVKKALEALDAVSEAAVSHESGTAVVTLSSDISDEKLKETVEAEEYKVTSIQ
ncbi:heavy metal translocating P-type ATPase [Agathobacter rectalis]|jgi:Cu2+-exporting ATPase|uniref:P-type Cu(+) transporter n=1 Tax=Agathobacter rectalis TaxID=39491 RepID=A0A414IYF7_9FIRM|nr:heavy metal translocating P-type ATPase [Agathobacter rectalis]RGT13808.1 heavy metal translocating P-type ATPase [Agathobacter rectalis]RGT21547.1 heavy metal translocating P-type ATPase [Agathobacter rectalis]RHE34655.1 heavy metal translocating P-type ATPase [Agathobacter rectalis]